MNNSHRLIFQLLSKENEHLVYELYNNPENTEFLHGINPEKDIALSLSCAEKYNIGVYLIFEKEVNGFVGVGGIQLQEPMIDGSFAIKNHEIEFLIILNNQFQGKGYASEFCQNFFAKTSAKYPNLKIPARVNPDNNSCIKLLKKFGFEEKGKTYYNNYGNEFVLLIN